MNLNDLIDDLLDREGGYVHHPADRGGATCWGITEAVARAEGYPGQMRALPREVAAFEPAGALFAGPDGLDDYRAIAPLLRAQIAPGGVACVEIGADQGESVSRLCREHGYVAVEVGADLAGHDRVVAARVQ